MIVIPWELVKFVKLLSTFARVARYLRQKISNHKNKLQELSQGDMRLNYQSNLVDEYIAEMLENDRKFGRGNHTFDGIYYYSNV